MEISPASAGGNNAIRTAPRDVSSRKFTAYASNNGGRHLQSESRVIVRMLSTSAFVELYTSYGGHLCRWMRNAHVFQTYVNRQPSERGCEPCRKKTPRDSNSHRTNENTFSREIYKVARNSTTFGSKATYTVVVSRS